MKSSLFFAVFPNAYFPLTCLLSQFLETDFFPSECPNQEPALRAQQISYLLRLTVAQKGWYSGMRSLLGMFRKLDDAHRSLSSWWARYLMLCQCNTYNLAQSPRESQNELNPNQGLF